jgi:hypothetical protein
VRPSHLFEGTKVDNNADRDAKGRTARGARHWSNLRPEQRLRAERHGMVKLTDQQTEQIRARFAAGAITQQALADEYGVWQTTISYIVRRTKRRA